MTDPRCQICSAPFGTALVGYPDDSDPGDPAEVWVGPGLPIEYALADSDGHPLTWGRVTSAHDFLMRHATCAGQAAAQSPSPDGDATGYDSDGDQCPCTWHPDMIEAMWAHRMAVETWPGPICGICWAASCVCGYVFDDVQHAHSRWPSGRPRCASCAP